VKNFDFFENRVGKRLASEFFFRKFYKSKVARFLKIHCHDSQGPKTSFHMTHPTFDSTMTCKKFSKKSKTGFALAGVMQPGAL
jgi:hypothetical protein